jgi:hypothetical protein
MGLESCEKMLQKFAFISLLFLCVGSQAKDLQVNCHFKKESKLGKLQPLDAVTANPVFVTKEKLEEYGFFIDLEKKRASYINFSFKKKLPLIIGSSSGGNITLLEDTTSSNRFIVTIFMEARKNQTVPAVMNVHAWDENIGKEMDHFFAPSTLIGTCVFV